VFGGRNPIIFMFHHPGSAGGKGPREKALRVVTPLSPIVGHPIENSARSNPKAFMDFMNLCFLGTII
jgi:hypothetical protein